MQPTKTQGSTIRAAATGLVRFEAAMHAEIKALRGQRAAALHAHDHGRARARRLDIERALRTLDDIAEFRG